MDLGLGDKVAIVGGASKGIGNAIATLLAKEGARVVMVARRAEALEAAAERIRAECTSDITTVAADIRVAADCERIVAHAGSAFGRIDVLVNNDGAPPLGPIAEFDDIAWAKAVEQNLMSVVRLSRGAIPYMRAAGSGRIINITALSVLQPIARFGLSVSTWAAVLGFAKTLSLEVAADQITVNTVCPGRVVTERLSKVFGAASNDAGDDNGKLLKDMAAQTPMGRLGTPQDIASAVAFLASAQAGYITGSTFHIDGGRRAALV